MNLPVLNLLNESPIEVFDGYRMPTYEEYVRGEYGLSDRIGFGCHQLSTPEELARWSIDHSSDIRNEIERRLNRSEVFRVWREMMPSSVPKNLNVYRNSYACADLAMVDEEIKSINVKMSVGQVLYHGGFLTSGFLGRPLSTTFCPEVARQEALWNGKADGVGAVNIYILRVISDDIFAYVYNIKASTHGDEMEVLISSGHRLKIGDVICTEECYGKVYNVIKAEIGHG